jgi:hypothetical protein
VLILLKETYNSKRRIFVKIMHLLTLLTKVDFPFKNLLIEICYIIYKFILITFIPLKLSKLKF